MGRRRLGPGRGRLDPSRQQSWVCPRIQERPQWGCSSCADPTGELGRCSVTAHHPDGVIVGVIRSADLPWDGFGRAPRRHRSIGVTGRCRRRPATSRPRDGDPSRRHTGGEQGGLAEAGRGRHQREPPTGTGIEEIKQLRAPHQPLIAHRDVQLCLEEDRPGRNGVGSTFVNAEAWSGHSSSPKPWGPTSCDDQVSCAASSMHVA